MKKKNQILSIIYYFIICLFLFFGIMKSKLGNMDELWNFLFAKNISKGLYPYKDFNIIVTPLSAFVNVFFLNMKPNLFVFRILYFIYYLVTICILNKITKLLKVKGILNYILIFVIIYLLLQACCLDYNFIQLILILLLIYLSLKNKNYQNQRLNILISIFAGLTVVNKQSTGLIICFITMMLILFEKRKNLKFILQQFIIMLIPSILLALYLIISKSFFDFYDLCVLGLLTFTNKLVLPNFLVILIIAYALMIILLHKCYNRELVIIFWYAIASLFVVVPIVDSVHSIMALIIPIIFFFYILSIELSKLTCKSSYLLVTIIIISIFAFSNIYSYMISPKIKSGVYKNIPADIQIVENINNVSKYILTESKKHNVYILDFTASLYNLNINRYTRYFDLFMNGNFGLNGEKEIYSIIDQKNQIILINNTVKNWQLPSKVISYVVDNYDRCGSIEQFDIYCN